jgi:hypothetical protein
LLPPHTSVGDGDAVVRKGCLSNGKMMLIKWLLPLVIHPKDERISPFVEHINYTSVKTAAKGRVACTKF